jgi:hypothetical protein
MMRGVRFEVILDAELVDQAFRYEELAIYFLYIIFRVIKMSQ